MANCFRLLALEVLPSGYYLNKNLAAGYWFKTQEKAFATIEKQAEIMQKQYNNKQEALMHANTQPPSPPSLSPPSPPTPSPPQSTPLLPSTQFPITGKRKRFTAAAKAKAVAARPAETPQWRPAEYEHNWRP